MKSFQSKAKDKLDAYNDIMVEHRVNEKLPCKSLMENAKQSLEELISIKEPAEFYKTVDKKRDDLLDNADDTVLVFEFFKGEQKRFFERALKYIQMFEDSKTYVRDQKISDNVAQMEAIINNKSPFDQIQKLPEMCEKFVSQYGALLDREAKEMEPVVADDYKKVMAVLDTKDFADAFRAKFAEKFEELKKKLETSHEIAAVKNIKLESDTLKLRCLDEISDYEIAHQSVSITPSAQTLPTDSGNPVEPMVQPIAPKVKRRKNLSISNVAGARTYTIESEADIDRFTEELKSKLKEHLDGDTILILS